MTETWYSRNREKAIAQAKEWRLANPDRARENVNRWKRENRAKVMIHKKKAAWRSYGIDITSEEYAQMEAAQGGLCKICEKPSKNGRKLAVDHCHDTGKVRGLLCTGCNIALSHIEAYLKRPAVWDAYLKIGSDSPKETGLPKGDPTDR